MPLKRLLTKRHGAPISTREQARMRKERKTTKFEWCTQARVARCELKKQSCWNDAVGHSSLAIVLALDCLHGNSDGSSGN